MRKKPSKNMARIMALVLAGLLVFSALFSAIYMIAAAESEEAARTAYDISAALLPSEQALRCEQTTVYANDTDGKLSQLFFACYANALRRQSLAPFDDADWDAAYPEGYAPGGIWFSSVRVNGKDADWGVSGDDETLLRVDVDIAPGESVRIDMVYDLLLPVCSGFLGAGSYDWRLTNAFPTVCAIAGGAIVFNPALTVGEFAYSDAADWSISLVAPDDWQFAASGVEISGDAEEGFAKWTASISGARDMAVALGRKHVLTGIQSQTGRAVTAYTGNRLSANAALEIVDTALAIFEGWFGAYPYPDLDIVMSECYLPEMSAPGLIWVNKELFRLGRGKDLEYALVFGLAKQFFGESVGCDPCDEPWLSDGISAFCALAYYRERYGDERFFTELNERVKPSLQLTIPGGVAPDTPALYFNSRYEYELIVRGRGAAALYELSDAMGADAFLSALGRYAAENAGARGTIDAFIDALESDGGQWGRFLIDALSSVDEYANQRLDWYE